MSVPWTEKGEKTNDLVADDEFMILDSEDTITSTINKRVKLQNVQANLITDVDGNDFDVTNLGSLSINETIRFNDDSVQPSASFPNKVSR